MVEGQLRSRKTVWAILSPPMRAALIILDLVVSGGMALLFHWATSWMCLNAVKHADCTLPVSAIELALYLQVCSLPFLVYALSRTTSSDPRLDALLAGQSGKGGQ